MKVKAKVAATLELREPMIQPRLGFSQLVVVFVLHSRGENENENQNENQNASSYENTMRHELFVWRRNLIKFRRLRMTKSRRSYSNATVDANGCGRIRVRDWS